MDIFPLKANSTYVKSYFAALAKFKEHGHTTEGNTRSAFADLLKRACGPYGWHLVEEYQFRGTKKQPLRADGALIDDLTLSHGIWEAKDTADDLKKEIRSKVEKGYPLTNTLFQSPDHAVLYQNSRIEFDKSLNTAENLVEVLQLFFDHQLIPGVDWPLAIKRFSEEIPSIALGIDKLLEKEDKANGTFHNRFEDFSELCRISINPELSNNSIRKMLVQHLLTERIFRKVFNNQEFLQRNVIAVEIEKVIRSITDKHFSRDQFLKSLDHFYIPLERAAEQQEDYTEKQHFLNAVYEKFFQSFDAKQADTHGIVYTPQPIVDFMVRSVEEILKQEFGKSLSDEGVHILDPFTGTGNFITRIVQEIKRSALPQKYSNELHCNEVMLLPYYIASMNIEHSYMARAGEYAPFEGICLVDTFDTTGQSSLFSTENTNRIKRQISAPIRIVIGNPPYNMGQVDENDSNKNRTYRFDGGIDSRVSRTYGAASKATLRNKLSDPYVKAFRWATDRIKDHGIVCYVSNNSFVDQIAFDGMREHLMRDYSTIYVIDLGGNVRVNPKLSGTTHNVFGIQVGVAITILVRHDLNDTQKMAEVFYTSTPAFWRRTQKFDQLVEWGSTEQIRWKRIIPDHRNTWLNEDQKVDFNSLMPVGSVSEKGEAISETVFRTFSLGIVSSRDTYVYNWKSIALQEAINGSIKAYDEQLTSYLKMEEPRPDPDSVIDVSDARIKWSHMTKVQLKRLETCKFTNSHIRNTLYRPFTKQKFYFDKFWNERRYQLPHLLPTPSTEIDNRLICLAGPGFRSSWSALATNLLPTYTVCSTTDAFQCFSFYTYDENGGNRRENITDWALARFREHYEENSITKWDIFHATYAILHHSGYRTRYAANLKRELPRIPFPPDFHAFAAAGKRLMDLHIEYEQQPEYKLEQIEDPKAEISFRVQKMKLSKDKTELRYNDFLLLRGIPAGVYDYRLGNRSALEWVIDQYQVSTDKRSGIINDPNREDDPKYILRLIGQVITVSLETNAIVASLPTLGLPNTEQQPVASQAEPTNS